jgi:hypothetical protein
MIEKCHVRGAWQFLRMQGIGAMILMTLSTSALCSHSAEPLQPAPPPFYPDKMGLLVWRDGQGAAHRVQDPEAWQQRRQHILANMQLVMGPLPERGREVPLDVQVLQTENLPKVTRQKILYTAGAGDRVPAYLLIPQALQGRAPAILCLHGTSGPRGRTAGLGADYPRYTLELAERGYVTIAPDYTLLGENQTDPASLGYVSGTMKGIWDHIRAVDLLQSLPEVDGEHAPQSDGNFRLDSVQRCVQAAATVYALFAVGDRLAAVYPPGGHGFPSEAREDAYRFVDQVLGMDRQEP